MYCVIELLSFNVYLLNVKNLNIFFTATVQYRFN